MIKMRRITFFCLLTLAIFLISNKCCFCSEVRQPDPIDYPELWYEAQSVYEFSVKDLNGNETSLEKYKGLVLVIINIATDCSFASTNFRQLKNLQQKYYSNGFRILAFPCNQFLFEEPYDVASIKKYVSRRRLNFEVYGKIDVNGKYTPQLWKYLKRMQTGYFFSFIKWNFTKFIIDRNGIPVERLTAFTSAEEFERKIVKYL